MNLSTHATNHATLSHQANDIPVLTEEVRVVSGRTLHQKQLNTLNHQQYKPRPDKIYLFVDPNKENIKECNRHVQVLFQKAGIGAMPHPIFTYRGVAMLVMPGTPLWDYPIAVFSHFVVTNLDKFIAIRKVGYLADRLALRKTDGLKPSHYDSLFTLSYDPYQQRCLHDTDNAEPQDYEISLRPWKKVDLRHRELKELSVKHAQILRNT